MKNKIEEKSMDAIKQCFSEVPFLKVGGLKRSKQIGSKQVDLAFVVEGAGVKKQIIVEVKSKGEPRLAREAVSQLGEFLEATPEAYGVFVSSYISREAARICKDKGIGYIDLAGNCYVSFDTVFIKNEGNPNPFSRKGDLRSLYSPKSERILRVLLETGPYEWKTAHLAREADVSLGLVSKVKKLLEDREWVESKTIGFSLTKPLALLEDWAKNYDFRRNTTQNYYSMFSTSELESKLSDLENENVAQYAFTGFSGAARFTNVVRYRTVMAYIRRDQESIKNKLDLKPVESGFNVTLLEPYDEGVFYKASIVDGSVVTSPVQIYLDLKNSGGRGEEAAVALLEDKIKSKW